MSTNPTPAGSPASPLPVGAPVSVVVSQPAPVSGSVTRPKVGAKNKHALLGEVIGTALLGLVEAERALGPGGPVGLLDPQNVNQIVQGIVSIWHLQTSS